MKHTVLIVLLVQFTSAQSLELFSRIASNLSITSKCRFQFNEFITDLNQNGIWAQQMVDAFSIIPLGPVTQKFEDLGDFEQCVSTKSNHGLNILGKYCLGYVSINSKTTLSFSAVPPVWAICLPNGCSIDDINKIGNAVLRNLLEDVSVNFSELLCQTIEDVEPKFSNGALVTSIILGLLFIIVTLATIYDVYSRNCPMVVKALSAYTNGNSIFKLNSSHSNQLPCLDGLKFISMMWIITLHQYSVPLSGSITNKRNLMLWSEHLYNMFIIKGEIAVDTFFTIGGTLMAYGFMRARIKNIPFNFFRYFLHRYLRLTASFAIVVLLSSTLIPYIGSGPKWPLFKLYFQKNCEENWWSALLYVQNYVNPNKMCVGQTWYVDIDIQLYFISPIFLFLLCKYPKVGLTLLGTCALASMSSAFYAVWAHNLPAITFGVLSSRNNDFQRYYYLLTHTRATPWIVGVILGYYIFKIKEKQTSFRLNKYIVGCLWILSFGTMLVCVLGGHKIFLSNEHYLENALHGALVRPAWSIAIAWIILACCNNYGGPIKWILSFSIYQVFNKFTYSMYLTHVTMLFGIAFSRKWPIYFSGFDMAYQFWGTLWFNAGLAILLVFMAEAPVMALEKILFGYFDRKSAKNDVEKGVDNNGFER